MSECLSCKNRVPKNLRLALCNCCISHKGDCLLRQPFPKIVCLSWASNSGRPPPCAPLTASSTPFFSCPSPALSRISRPEEECVPCAVWSKQCHLWRSDPDLLSSVSSLYTPKSNTPHPDVIFFSKGARGWMGVWVQTELSPQPEFLGFSWLAQSPLSSLLK